MMTMRRRAIYVIVGLALIFGTVIWSAHRSEHFIAGMALGLAAIALIWTIILAANLENIVERVGRDVKRIADAVAPQGDPDVESPAMPERLDRVAIAASRGNIEIPRASRDALLEAIRTLDSARPVVAAFEAGGASRPVELDVDGMVVVVEAVHVMGSNADGMDKIPPGLFELRNALLDELHDRDT